MQKKIISLVAVVVVVTAGLAFWTGTTFSTEAAEARPDKLAVLWTSGDPEVAHRMAFMYTKNAKTQKWFDRVRLIVWGPSARLLAGDKDLQAKVHEMMEAGVHVQACVVCARSYGVARRLDEMGIEVKGMGAPLSDMIKSDWHVLSL
jgi:hypothetical protein